jgi:hypothetical protein
VLVDELAERLAGEPGRVRVLLDGAPPTGPAGLAEGLAEELRLRGRPVLRVAAADFLRPASLRLEHGRDDPDELLHGWLDLAGLRREVLDPAGSAGTGWVLPRLWDAEVDRAYRDPRVELADNAVLLLSGALLLGRGLPAELTVHLRMSAAALARRTDPALAWTLPAYARYDAEHDPAGADVLVLLDDPARPALVQR